MTVQKYLDTLCIAMGPHKTVLESILLLNFAAKHVQHNLCHISHALTYSDYKYYFEAKHSSCGGGWVGEGKIGHFMSCLLLTMLATLSMNAKRSLISTRVHFIGSLHACCVQIRDKSRFIVCLPI